MSAAERNSPYREEFDAYCDRHYEPVLKRAESSFRERRDAEDVTQETFLQLWRRWPDRRETFLEVPGYVYGVLRNEIANHYRRNRERLAPSGSLHQQGADDDINPAEFVREVLRPLSPRIQEIAYRAFIEGQATPEIAADLGLAVGTVYNYRSIARKAVLAALSESVNQQ